MDHNAPPLGEWAQLAPAMIVSDLAASLRFWIDLLGFSIAYERPEDEFVYLSRSSAHVMLYQRCGMYETGALDPPYGRGIMLQIQVDDVGAVLAALGDRNWSIYQAIKDAWHRAGAVERGLRQFLVQDPDGYLLMIYEELGVRLEAKSDP